MGHYQKEFFGGYLSQINNPAFFLSHEGRDQPEAELRATLAAFQAPAGLTVGPLQQSPACAFPARYAWLQKKFDLPPPPKCTDFEDWRDGLSAKSVSLVFSSAYPNNPASMFGHTLLRLNRADGEPVLNYGVNFEAKVASKDSSFAYAIKGLLGFYSGDFALAPYYTKVNEYNFSESRDLWEYDLSLSEMEVSILVSHLWELYTSASMPYYFLTRNCSYQLLSLLEAAKPEWDLLPGWSPYVLPADTLKKISQQKGAVTEERLRPSLHNQMEAQLAQLNGTQLAIRNRILSGDQLVADVSDFAVLESLLTTFDYRRRKQAGNLPPKEDALFRQVLLRRASLGAAPTQSKPFDHADSPLLSHDSGLLTLGGLYRGGSVLTTLGGRLALHDLLDPISGYPPGLQVESVKLKLSIGKENDQKKLRLEEFGLLDLLSLYPANVREWKFSWGLRIGAYRPLDFGQKNVLALGAALGPGLALSIGRESGWIYMLALAQGEWIRYSKNARYGPGSELGAIFYLGKKVSLAAKMRTGLELNGFLSRNYFWQGETEFAYTWKRNLQARFHSRMGGPRVTGTSSTRELGGELRWYF